MAALMRAAFSAAPAPVPRALPLPLRSAVLPDDEARDGAVESGAAKAVEGSETVWRVSWRRARGYRCRRMRGARRAARVDSAAREAGPARAGRGARVSGSAGEVSGTVLGRRERTTLAAQRAEVDVEGGTVDELVADADLGGPGDGREDGDVSCEGVVAGKPMAALPVREREREAETDQRRTGPSRLRARGGPARGRAGGGLWVRGRCGPCSELVELG